LERETPWAFSILGRIEPTATSPAGGGLGKRGPFQYPRSDRAHCNTTQSLLFPSRWGSFSILGRIEPTATPRFLRFGGHLTGFQYPRSDRAHCNLDGASSSSGNTRLSVSSVGSSPLQLALWVAMPQAPQPFSILGRIEPTATLPSPIFAARGDALSVSSVGSSPLQLGRTSGRSMAIRTFSILGRIEPTATS